MARTATWLHNSGHTRRAAWKYRAADNNELFIEVVALDTEAQNTAAAASGSSQVIKPAAWAGASTDGPKLDLAGTRLTGFIAGPAWNAGTVSFKVSIDGTNYFTLYNIADNTPRAYTISAGRAYDLDPSIFIGWRYVQPISSVSQATGTLLSLATQVV